MSPWVMDMIIVAALVTIVFSLGWFSCYVTYESERERWDAIADSQTGLNRSFEAAHSRLYESVIRPQTLTPDQLVGKDKTIGQDEAVSHEKPGWTPPPRDVDTFVIHPTTSRMHRRGCGNDLSDTQDWPSTDLMTDRQMLEFALENDYEVCSRCILNDDELRETIKELKESA